MRLKSSLPNAFCSALNVQLSVPVHCRSLLENKNGRLVRIDYGKGRADGGGESAEEHRNLSNLASHICSTMSF